MVVKECKTRRGEKGGEEKGWERGKFNRTIHVLLTQEMRFGLFVFAEGKEVFILI